MSPPACDALVVEKAKGPLMTARCLTPAHSASQSNRVGEDVQGDERNTDSLVPTTERQGN
jgi:hypothetical protein